MEKKILTRQAAFARPGPNVWDVHQRPRGLSQWLVMDCVCRCGRFLLGSFSEIVLSEEHGRSVVWTRGQEKTGTVRDFGVCKITVVEALMSWGAANSPTVSIVSLSSMRSWALGMSMCMRNVCCCLFRVSEGRVFLLGANRADFETEVILKNRKLFRLLQSLLDFANPAKSWTGRYI